MMNDSKAISGSSKMARISVTSKCTQNIPNRNVPKCYKSLSFQQLLMAWIHVGPRASEATKQRAVHWTYRDTCTLILYALCEYTWPAFTIELGSTPIRDFIHVVLLDNEQSCWLLVVQITWLQMIFTKKKGLQMIFTKKNKVIKIRFGYILPWSNLK